MTEASNQIIVETDILDELLGQIVTTDQRIDDLQSETRELSTSAQEALNTLEQILI